MELYVLFVLQIATYMLCLKGRGCFCVVRLSKYQPHLNMIPASVTLYPGVTGLGFIMEVY